MKLQIRHEISIAIGAGVTRAVQHILMTPRSHAGQTVIEWSVDGPGVPEAASFTDAFGNRALLVNQSKPEAELVVSARGVVETHDRHGVVGREATDPVPAIFIRATPWTKAGAALAEGLDGKTRDRIALFHRLMEKVGDGAPEGAQTQEQSTAGQSQSQSQGLGSGAMSGDPAELSHRFIGALRALQIPARYVTGYLAADEEQVAAFHAWAEAYDERLGWIGFDCALQLCPTERHVRLATGLDAISAAPVRSVPAAGAPHALTLAVEAAQ